jgi:hypothetical protein
MGAVHRYGPICQSKQPMKGCADVQLQQVPAFVLAFLVALLCGGTGVAWGAAPAIKGISPNNGSVTGGTQVTISGEGFISGSTVKFGSSAGTGVTVASSTQIKVTSPVGTGLAGI